MTWLEQCSIDVVVGDVLDLEADALVLATKDGPRPYGRLTRSIVERCGDGLLQALAAEQERRRVDRQPFGRSDSLLIDAAGCGIPGYRHVLAVCLWEDEGNYTPAGLAGGWSVALRALIQMGGGARSAVFPVIAAGGWRERMDAYGRIVADVFEQFDRLRGSGGFSVEEVTLVATRQAEVDSLERALSRLE